MAEVEKVLGRPSDDSGVFTLSVFVETTQTQPDPNPWAQEPSPLVVSVKLVNTSTKPGRCTWQSTNGDWISDIVLPGENKETRISPARREYLWQWCRHSSAGWG